MVLRFLWRFALVLTVAVVLVPVVFKLGLLLVAVLL